MSNKPKTPPTFMAFHDLEISSYRHSLFGVGTLRAMSLDGTVNMEVRLPDDKYLLDAVRSAAGGVYRVVFVHEDATPEELVEAFSKPK